MVGLAQIVVICGNWWNFQVSNTEALGRLHLCVDSFGILADEYLRIKHPSHVEVYTTFTPHKACLDLHQVQSYLSSRTGVCACKLISESEIWCEEEGRWE